MTVVPTKRYEEDAKQCRCPFRTRAAKKEDGVLVTYFEKCLGGECMAWSTDKGSSGYCLLVIHGSAPKM